MRFLLLLLFAIPTVAQPFLMSPALMASRSTASGSALPADPTITWVKFNEGSGTTPAATAGPNYTTDADWSASTQSSASCLAFTAANGDSAQSASALTYGVSNITVTFWVYANAWNSTSTGTNLCESSANVDGGSGGLFQVYTADSVVYVYFIDGSGALVYLSHFATPSATAWHHFAIVINNTTGSVLAYVDGSSVTVTVDFSNWAVAGAFSNQIIYLGSRADTSKFFSGRIDDFRIYNSILTAPQIAAIYAANAQ